MFDAKKRVAKIGFDPATAEGWKSIGIDPALGIYAVFDAAILEAGDTPIVALGVTDLDKLLAFAKKSGKKANIVADEGGLKRVVAGTETIGLISTKGDYTYFCPKTNRGSLKAVRAAFTEFLKNSGTAPKVSLIPGKAAAGQFIAGVDLQKLLKQVKKAPVDAAGLGQPNASRAWAFEWVVVSSAWAFGPAKPVKRFSISSSACRQMQRWVASSARKTGMPSAGPST